MAHDTFRLERSYDAPVARVWRALTDEAAKQKWFGGTPGSWELLERHTDVRVGGREWLKGRWEGGMVSTFEAIYHDVITNERLVYSYEMYLDDKKISVSLATLQLKAAGGKTTLMVTEQGAFLDGYDDEHAVSAGSRHTASPWSPANHLQNDHGLSEERHLQFVQRVARCAHPTLLFPRTLLGFIARTNLQRDMQWNVVHTWQMPYPPGQSGYLTDRGTLFYNGQIPNESHVGRAPYRGG